MASLPRIARTSLLALTASLSALSLAITRPAQAEIRPAYFVDGNQAGNNYTFSQSSLGLSLQVTEPGYVLNALGLGAQKVWLTHNNKYTVKFWSFNPSTFAASSFSEIASVEFDPANAASYETTKCAYDLTLICNYWQSIAPKPLLPTTSDFAYMVAAIGDFSKPGDSNIYVAQGGATFQAPFALLPNGIAFNADDPAFTDFPLPVYEPPTSTPAVTIGYWNGNVSATPGPLPVAAAIAGFGMSRRLRQRIRSSR